MRIILALFVSLLLVACGSKTLSSTQVVDDRPSIQLDLSRVQPSQNLELVINGLSYGTAEAYMLSVGQLRLVPGYQRIEIKRQGQLIFSTEVVLAEGTERIIQVVRHD